MYRVVDKKTYEILFFDFTEDECIRYCREHKLQKTVFIEEFEPKNPTIAIYLMKAKGGKQWIGNHWRKE